MCRHVGYLGPPVRLDELLITPEHSLAEQAWAPTDMRSGGTINVDGFGAGWYPPGAGSPLRYRRCVPMWTDANFAVLSSSVTSGAVVGAVRSASSGTPVTDGACAPFGGGDWLFSHNGRVSGWPESVAGLAAKLDITELLTLDAPVDSALVWALLRARLDGGQPPVEAVGDTVRELVTAAPDSRMNLLLTDGTVLVATTWTHALSVWHGAEAVAVASEPFAIDDTPLTDGAEPSPWRQVPDRHLVVARPGQVSVTPLT